MGDRRVGWLALVLLAALVVGPSAANGAARTTRALYFGDSLFVGSGSVPRRPVQVQVANGQLGWLGEIDAFGGTGYTTGGPHGRPYLDRLRHDGMLSRRFDVIVLEGGTNDAHHGSLERLLPDALAVVDYVHHRQPSARIVIVGGFAHRGSSSRYAEMDRILAKVAADRGLLYVSQLRYATSGPGFYSPDDLHPSTRGYTQMGRDLAAALARG